MRNLKVKLILTIILSFLFIIPFICSIGTVNPNYNTSALNSNLSHNSSWLYIWDEDMWSGNAIITDSLENVYCIGKAGHNGQFFSKLNNSGDEEWIVRDFGSSSAYNYRIAINSQSNIYLIWENGYNKGSIIKFNSSGGIMWNKSLGISPFSMYLDKDDNIYIAGSLDFYSEYPFLKLIKFNKLGILELNKSILMTEIFLPYALWVDNLNNSFIAGIWSEENDGLYAYTPEVYLWCLNSTGGMISTKKWNMSPYNVNYNLKFDNLGQLYLIATDSSFSVNMIFKYNHLGESMLNITWESAILEDASDLWNKITFDSSRNIYCVGSDYFFIKKVYYEIYLVIFNENGTLLQNGAWKEYESAGCNDIYIDSDQNLYLTGSFSTGGLFYHGFLVKNPVIGDFSPPNPIFHFNLDEETIYTLIILTIIFGIWSLLGLGFYLYFLRKRSH